MDWPPLDLRKRDLPELALVTGRRASAGHEQPQPKKQQQLETLESKSASATKNTRVEQGYLAGSNKTQETSDALGVEAPSMGDMLDAAASSPTADPMCP